MYYVDIYVHIVVYPCVPAVSYPDFLRFGMSSCVRVVLRMTLVCFSLLCG